VNCVAGGAACLLGHGARRYPWCKSEAFVAAPPEFVLEMLWDAGGRQEWDEYAKKERCSVVQQVMLVWLRWMLAADALCARAGGQ